MNCSGASKSFLGELDFGSALTMKVFALGGTGRIGREAAKILARRPDVSDIAIAARDPAVAKRVVAEIGPKAVAVETDAIDEARLVAIVEPYDLIVNTAGPDFRVALPAVRAAIAAGKHYCDISADGPSTQEALALDGRAKAAGVTAIMGIGHMPGISNLLMRHAANRFDAVEGVRFCAWWALSPETFTVMGDPEDMRTTGRVNASWQTILAWVAGRVRTYREGRWIDVDPFGEATEVALPVGDATAIPVGSTEPVTLPRYVPGVRDVEALLVLDPPQLNELLHEQARRIVAGEESVARATLTFLETIGGDPGRWLGGARRIPPGFGELATATGWNGGRRVRYSCWPAGEWPSTVGPLIAAAGGILRGEIRERGVLPPEAVLDPLTFLREASRYGRDPPGPGSLLRESLDVVS